MNMRQVRWAMQHDWFIGSYHKGGVFVVVVHHDTELFDTLAFDDYTKLRAWARY